MYTYVSQVRNYVPRYIGIIFYYYQSQFSSVTLTSQYVSKHLVLLTHIRVLYFVLSLGSFN